MQRRIKPQSPRHKNPNRSPHSENLGSIPRHREKNNTNEASGNLLMIRACDPPILLFFLLAFPLLSHRVSFLATKKTAHSFALVPVHSFRGCSFPGKSRCSHPETLRYTLQGPMGFSFKGRDWAQPPPDFQMKFIPHRSLSSNFVLCKSHFLFKKKKKG
jgi:hypothetical protein